MSLFSSDKKDNENRDMPDSSQQINQDDITSGGGTGHVDDRLSDTRQSDAGMDPDARQQDMRRHDSAETELGDSM